MPLKSPQNHKLMWTDLLEGVAGASWFQVISLIYNREHGYSNFNKCKKRNHQQVRLSVLEDDRVKRYLELGDESRKQVEKVLDEMCHLLSIQQNPTRKLKIAGAPFLKCITQIYSSIYVNTHLLPLKSNELLGVNLFREQYLEMSEKLPIVILPTHRSYMDFLFISYIMFINELPLPIVAAGDNFKAMGKLLTDYLKGTGAFLIRRNAHKKNDIEAAVYYDILRAYVHSIIEGGENPLEFFMEGTRTRVGQVLRPKTGLLSMVVDMYVDGKIDDIYIMPVSINYQRPIEEQLYVAETTPQINMRKPRESAKNLVSAMEAIMKRKYGKVYVRFIEPFKLSGYFEQWKLESSLSKVEMDDRVTLLHEFTTSLASKICLAQAHNNVLMPFNLLACSVLSRSFLNNIFNDEDSQNLIEDKAPIQVPIEFCANDFYLIEELLRNTQSQFLPGWTGNLEIFDEFKIDRDEIIRPSADRKFIEFHHDAVTFNTMLYYSNQVMQTLLPVAICLLISEEPVSCDSPIERYKSIRSLLSREFLMDSLFMKNEYETSNRAIESKLVSVGSRGILIKLLAYFVKSYSVFLNYLKENKVLLKTQFLHRSMTQHRGLYISKDMFRNMFNLVKEMEICRVVSVKQDKFSDEDQLEVVSEEKLIDLIDQFQQVLSTAKLIILH